MLDLRANTIIYQSQGYLVTLVDSLILNKRLGKALNKKWSKADLILSYLEAWEERLKLDDITQMNYILECLIQLCELNQFPAAPTVNVASPPAILFGLPGPKGATGDTGATGATGLATDFQSTFAIPTVVDTFTIASAKAARWDYTVTKSGTGEQRSGSIIGTWKSDGSAIDMFDNSTPDIVGDTSFIEFDVIFSAGNIQLLATPTSGTWTVVGSRYFIPNNGNGSGPVSSVLPNGTIYIGNASNQATSQTVSGVITITNTGVTSFNGTPVTNAVIAAGAGILVNKLQALTASVVVGTDASGFLTSSGITTATLTTKLGYVDVGSSLTTLLAAKMPDPMTSIGDIVIRNASNVTTRLAIGATNQVLTVVGGVPAWANVPGGITGLTTGTVPKASSSTTLTNSIITDSGTIVTVAGGLDVTNGIRTNGGAGPYLKTKVIALPTWNMNPGFATSTSVAHGVTASKIRSVTAIIVDDAATVYLDAMTASNGTVSPVYWDSTSVVVSSLSPGGYFANANYQSTASSRGWVTITYEV